MNYNRGNGFSGIGSFIFDKDTTKESLNYNVIDYSTPNLSVGQIEIKRDGRTGAIPGDFLLETSVPLRFIVDENLEVFFSLHELMLKYSQERTLDIFTIKITNNKHKIIAQMVYEHCFINNVSPIQYSTDNEETTIYIDVQLSFLNFKPEKV